ncbi:hypothetical protein TRVL_09587 [Trypanosoma vivax]|uniref:Uncharacterized protein n=1 Tax=Trypanosoma vivax (strain Y486) TaxID=1055687 RepID=G0U2J8_TRYVY|nr:hypothetical protein TRVL_09587 [Trypanosoma vivax]CCC50501.1 hypothetical protein TVY486_0903220 [Trypanosoma vivax Y486]
MRCRCFPTTVKLCQRFRECWSSAALMASTAAVRLMVAICERVHFHGADVVKLCGSAVRVPRWPITARDALQLAVTPSFLCPSFLKSALEPISFYLRHWFNSGPLLLAVPYSKRYSML